MQRKEGVKMDFTRVTDGEKLSGNLRDAIESAMELKEEKRPESVRSWLVLLGFEMEPVAGIMQQQSKETLGIQEAQLKIKSQKLDITAKQLALVFAVVTAVVGAIGWGVKTLQTEPSNSSPLPIQQEEVN